MEHNKIAVNIEDSEVSTALALSKVGIGRLTHAGVQFRSLIDVALPVSMTD